MRITLTGRRLALAAVFVLAGVAAPLAWATVAGKGDSTPSVAAAASPAPFRLAPRRSAPLRSAPLPSVSDSKQAARSTGDNPYQVVTMFSTITLPSESCASTDLLPAGVNFALTEVSAFGNVPVTELYIYAFMKTATGQVVPGFKIPVEEGPAGSYSGARSFDWVVKPNPPASAAIGDIYDILGCVHTSYAGGTFAFTFTGQKISGPSAASVSDFNARQRAQGALLRWTTASENNLLGFNVWRYRGAKGVKVNRTLIRAKRSGEPAGASYRYIDNVRGAKRGLTYRLQLVDLKGKRTWYAAFAIASK